MTIDQVWLPEGHHYDLHVERTALGNAGAFTGGGWKIVLHTTESDWDSVDAIRDLFVNRENTGEGSHPNFLIGAGIGAKKHPSVVQFIALNRAAKALKHPPGTSETNRANCVQIEICGFASESGKWPESRYKAIANLLLLINHRRPIAAHIPKSFASSSKFSSGAFVAARGYVGHRHVPFNDHTDPGSTFRASHLLELLANAPCKL